MEQQLFEELTKAARACRILEREGHGDMSLGHLSYRDPEGRGFWLKRNAYGLGEIESADDFVLVDFHGKQLEGAGGRHSEWPIHSEILLARPDINVVVHTHALHASILASAGEQPFPYTLDADYFGDMSVYRGQAALIVSVEEGQAMAKTLGSGLVLLIPNHGIVFCGTSVEHATCVGVFLERASRIHLIGRAAGVAAVAPESQVRDRRRAQIMTPRHITHSWDYFSRELSRAEAS